MQPHFTCPACGGPIQPGSAECPRCGYPRVRKDAQAPGASSTPRPVQAPSPEPKRFKLGPGQFAAILAAVLLAVFVGPVFYVLYSVPGAHGSFCGLQGEGGAGADQHVQETHAEDRQSLPELHVEASRLGKDYEAAGGALMGRRVSVTGTVGRVEGAPGDPCVVLDGGVRCLMDEPVRFAKGQTVILSGIVGAYYFGNVELRGCRVRGEGPPPEERTALNKPERPASAKESRRADDGCSRTAASWDAWFSAEDSFRKEHPQCRPKLSLLRAPAVEADRLRAEYAENEVAAEEAYMGRVLVVTGAVSSVDTDMAGTPTVWLEAQGRRLGVSCELDPAERRKAAALRKGQAAAVAGRVGMSVMHVPSLEWAVLLGAEQAPEGRRERKARR